MPVPDRFTWYFFSPRIHQIDPASFLDGKRKYEVLYAEVGHVRGAGDVQVLEDGAALAEDGEDLVVTHSVQHNVTQLLHLL